MIILIKQHGAPLGLSPVQLWAGASGVLVRHFHVGAVEPQAKSEIVAEEIRAEPFLAQSSR